jgi:hypothetical protein
MYIHRRIRTLAQILDVILLGNTVCGDCNSFMHSARRKGLICKKENINFENEEHVRMIEEARAGNKGAKLVAPIVCLRNADGGLSLVGSGYAMKTVMDLVKLEESIQSELLLVQEAVAV